MKTYLRLIKYVKAHMLILAIAAFLMIVSSALQPISFGALIPFIDRVLEGKQLVIQNDKVPDLVVRVVAKINSTSPGRLLVIFVIFLIFVVVTRAIFTYFQQYLMREVSQRVVRGIRNSIYDKLLDLSMDFYTHSKTGTLVSRITYDSTIIQDAVAEGLTDLIFQSFVFIFSAITIFFISFTFNISPIFLIAILLGVPLIVVPLVQIGRKLKKISKRSQESMAEINDILFESISGMRIVKGFCMENYEKEKFRKANCEFKSMVMKSNMRILAISPLTEMATLVCGVFILWFGGRQVISGHQTMGTLTAFLLAIISMYKPINRLSRVNGVNQQALAAATRIFEILDTETSIKEKKGARALSLIKDKIEFKNIGFKYEDHEVLTDISFEVKVGGIVAFVGPSGAGKTTLVNLLPRFYDPVKGSIMIDGADLRDFTIRSLRDHIGIVTQETILFHDTVASNIAFGNKVVDMKKVIEAAKTANAHDFVMKLPKQYDTAIGERGFRLSGGERQRLAIARAVFKNPPLLIFDEATSQLDSESEKLVQEAIDRLMVGRTVFMIAHRLSTIKHADTIIVIERGKIVEMGKHQVLIDRGGTYKKLYAMQHANL